MSIRTYSLNSREAYEALRRDPNDLWGPPRCGEPRMPQGGEDVGPVGNFHAVPPEQNIDEDERQQAREWLWHLENGRIGGQNNEESAVALSPSFNVQNSQQSR